MSKKGNNVPKTGAAAPEVEQNENKKPQTTENKDFFDFTKVLSPGQMQSQMAGLDPNHRMDMIKVMHETFRMDPMAPSHTGFSAEAVGQINKINAAMQVAALICETAIAKNPFTMLMPPAMIQNIKEIGAEMGVSLKTNLLPAPDKDGNVEVPSEAIVVEKETKKAVKEEVKIMDEVPETNPQLIKDEEGLRKAAIYVLADTKTNVRPYNRIKAAIDLYYSWLYFQAADDAAKEQLKNTSKVDLFRKLVSIIGACPFSMSGISKILFTTTSRTKTPISAFCMLRNNSLDSATGHPTADDQDIADITRILVEWHANSLINRDKESIETCKQNIEVLSKNKKQNKAAIEKEKEKIKNYEEAIQTYKDVLQIVDNPDNHYADVFSEAYFDINHEDYKTVRRLASEILKTYYGPTFDIKNVEHESLKKTMQMYIGVILNFFREPLLKIQGYSEEDIPELVIKKEDDAKEESQSEQQAEEPKK